MQPTRAAIAVLAAALGLAGCAGGPGRHGPDGPRRLKPIAEPGQVVATELAFARMAQEEGQWTAFADYAADDAVMFTPERVRARDWLKGRADPPSAVTWQPHELWLSCDGGLALSRGAWQTSGGQGEFVTIWQRQEDGGFKFVLDDGHALATPLAEPEMIASHVAKCDPKPGPAASVAPADGGASPDRTLSWRIEPRGGGQALVVDSWNGSEDEPVLDWAIAAPGGGAPQ